MFEEYKDLYKLTSKTVDDHIEFYKKKETLPIQDLFNLWRKLSQQAENFDKRNWYESWNHKNKNFHAFDSHKFEAKYLIQGFLTDVLEELLDRVITKYEKYVKSIDERTKLPQKISDDELSSLIKREVKRQLKKELANQKQKTRKKIK